MAGSVSPLGGAVDTRGGAPEKPPLPRQAACHDIELEAEKNDRIQAEIAENLKQSRLMMENLGLREKKVAAREKEIKSFRKHGKGAR